MRYWWRDGGHSEYLVTILLIKLIRQITTVPRPLKHYMDIWTKRSGKQPPELITFGRNTVFNCILGKYLDNPSRLNLSDNIGVMTSHGWPDILKNMIWAIRKWENFVYNLWWEIDIHGCYSLVKIAFAPICTCKNNRQIWRHNASISRSRDVTDQLWWRHNAKSEKAVLGDSCEKSDRWWFLADWCVPGHKIACKK